MCVSSDMPKNIRVVMLEKIYFLIYFLKSDCQTVSPTDFVSIIIVITVQIGNRCGK